MSHLKTPTRSFVSFAKISVNVWDSELNHSARRHRHFSFSNANQFLLPYLIDAIEILSFLLMSPEWVPFFHLKEDEQHRWLFLCLINTKNRTNKTGVFSSSKSSFFLSPRTIYLQISSHHRGSGLYFGGLNNVGVFPFVDSLSLSLSLATFWKDFQLLTRVSRLSYEEKREKSWSSAFVPSPRSFCPIPFVTSAVLLSQSFLPLSAFVLRLYSLLHGRVNVRYRRIIYRWRTTRLFCTRTKMKVESFFAAIDRATDSFGRIFFDRLIFVFQTFLLNLNGRWNE